MWGLVAKDLWGQACGLSETNINNEMLIPSVLLSFSPPHCLSVCHFLSVSPWPPIFFLISSLLHTHFFPHQLSALYQKQAQFIAVPVINLLCYLKWLCNLCVCASMFVWVCSTILYKCSSKGQPWVSQITTKNSRSLHSELPACVCPNKDLVTKAERSLPYRMKQLFDRHMLCTCNIVGKTVE